MTTATQQVTLEAIKILGDLFTRAPLDPIVQATLVLTINGVIMQLDRESRPPVIAVLLHAFKSHPHGQVIVETLKVVEAAAEDEAHLIVEESYRARKN